MDRAVIATLILFIILEQNYAERSLFKLGRFRMLTSLGRISYGLYCLHFIGILITLTLTKHLGLNTHFWQIALIEVPVSLLLTVGFARLSYRYFESPFLVLKVRYAHVSSGGAKQGPLDAPSEP
jgi:peptidoglycan/LPS O-acetylase OafA/YrhL